MRALLANKMILNLACLATVLAIDVALGVHERRRHGLHAYGGIEHREMIRHVFHALHAQRARVASSSIFLETLHVHDVTAVQTF